MLYFLFHPPTPTLMAVIGVTNAHGPTYAQVKMLLC